MTQGARHDEIKCPFCPKHISEKSLMQHIELKHTEAGQELSKESAAKRNRQWWRKQVDSMGRQFGL